FSTLAKRRFYCEEEVRLNRRLAPDVYLGVVPVTLDGGRARFEAQGEAVEWAVKMVRLPDEATLHARLERGEGTIEQAEMLARRIAAFHRDAPPAPRAADFQAVSRNILDVTLRGEERGLSNVVRERVVRAVEERLAELRPLIERRAMCGAARDCHGDLHLDHVYLFPANSPPGDLVIVDCIEFNERFRFIDPVADMAFAAMDFTYHGRPELARAFSEAYFRESGDHEGTPLLDLYVAYRAGVRASVDLLKSQEREVPAEERHQAVASAWTHQLLALGRLETASKRPCLLLVSGLPGSGKSTLARTLASTGFEVIRSDQVRKQLATAPSGPKHERGDSIYTTEWNDRTYQACSMLALEHLQAGKRVVVDATFRMEKHRQAFLMMARSACVVAGMLVCRANPSVIQTRLAQRRGDVSDADWSVYELAAKEWEPLGSQTVRVVRHVDTTADQDEVLRRALAALTELGMWD
ncbi:MAG TPA: AAA family ATPase, partial [Gemmataceae bacterium]|nr:AAA family ATPase [Gemmataceae bacterium]